MSLLAAASDSRPAAASGDSGRKANMLYKILTGNRESKVVSWLSLVKHSASSRQSTAGVILLIYIRLPVLPGFMAYTLRLSTIANLKITLAVKGMACSPPIPHLQAKAVTWATKLGMGVFGWMLIFWRLATRQHAGVSSDPHLPPQAAGTRAPDHLRNPIKLGRG